MKLIPDSLRKDEFTVALMEAFEIQYKELQEEIELYSVLSNVDTLPEVLIDYLAYEKHVEYYEDLTIEKKRNIVQNAIEIHRKKGTKFALLRVLELLNMDGNVEEWFEYDGDPFNFKMEVDVSERGISEQSYILLEKLIGTYKNGRSWLEAVNVSLNSKDNLLQTTVIQQSGEEITVYPG